MSDDMSEFQMLVGRVREGSQEAAWELIAQYGPHVMRIVRRKLPQELRRKFDSEDFAQAAWASVFRHRSRLVRFRQPGEFVAFLAAVAGNKVAMEVRRRLGGQKHNITRERSLDQMNGARDATSTREPRPSQIAVARERWFQLLREQPPHYQRMIEMRYRGLSVREIAQRLDLDEGTVRRALRKIFRSIE